jgi:hypothetical protein
MPMTKLTLAASLLLGAAVIGNPPAAYAMPTDGNWSVLIITEKGTCDRAYRYTVRISHGRLVYEGSAPVNLAGTVAPNGRVKVSVKAGSQGASGTGRLSGSEGVGTWRGRSSAGECAGRWEAERR